MDNRTAYYDVTNVNKKGADVDIKGWSGKATLRRQHFNEDLKEDTGGRKKTRACPGRRRGKKLALGKTCEETVPPVDEEVASGRDQEKGWREGRGHMGKDLLKKGLFASDSIQKPQSQIYGILITYVFK